MENSEEKLELQWEKQSNESMKNTLKFLKEISPILTKNKFPKLYPDIIHKLLKSNDKLWGTVEEGTKGYREFERTIPNAEQVIQQIIVEKDKIEHLTEDEISAKDKQQALQDIQNYFEFFKENFDPETNILTDYKPVNTKWSDLDLIEFCYNHINNISTLIDNQIQNGDTPFDKETLMVEYISQLFAMQLQGCQIEVTDSKIKVK